jgi:hypothetical protein
MIDDDVLVRQALGDCVESVGYAVEGFGSAEEFLASGATETASCFNCSASPVWNFRTSLPGPTTVCQSYSSARKEQTRIAKKRRGRARLDFSPSHSDGTTW